ncbi:hypothetical protein [Asanoa iriomotensis]|uniref:LPXTG-motif cell wall-anchored protein n=1 Tax=Asanoa iriomotensis TaxID=234613 RepID=A0ABQ4BV24_9ACTN|nr:hypothetical protein [Asanoa iriomotensis]GIF54011.1 hypothetical protein Air01nite_01060 [Asanoa iriomotensis]
MILLRTAVALGAAALTLALPAAAASAVEVTGVTVDGASATVSGAAARPGAAVVVTAATGSGPDIDVASCGGSAGAAGTWSCVLTRLGPGRWTLSATDGTETTPLRAFQVGPGGPPADPPALATTGDPLDLPLTVAGAALLALGAGLLWRSRSRVPETE